MKQVLLLLPQGVELLEAAAFADVFGWDGLLGSRGCRLISAGPEQSVKPGFGPGLTAELTFAAVKAEDYAALALPGGFPRHGYLRKADQRLFGLIREFGAQSLPIAAVCTGSLLLAEAGILQGRRAATYGGKGTDFAARLTALGAVFVDRPLVRDGNIVTASGPGQAVDAALALLETLTSPENAARIRSAMLF